MLWKPTISLKNKLLCTALQKGVRSFSISNALKKSHYETLGVKQDASQAEIKNAYFELSKIYHPDRIAATDENLAKFREISAAYEILGNEQSRKLYDRGLLGDTKKVGVDKPEDPNDPIIRFYKQREKRHQVPVPGRPESDMDIWTKTFYKEARKKVFKKNELFQETKKSLEKESEVSKMAFISTAIVVLVILFLTNLEDHPMEKTFRQLTGSEKSVRH